MIYILIYLNLFLDMVCSSPCFH